MCSLRQQTLIIVYLQTVSILHTIISFYVCVLDLSFVRCIYVIKQNVLLKLS